MRGLNGEADDPLTSANSLQCRRHTPIEGWEPPAPFLFRDRSKESQQILDLLAVQLIAEFGHDWRLPVRLTALGDHRDNKAVGEPLVGLLVGPVVGADCGLEPHEVGAVTLGAGTVASRALLFKQRRAVLRIPGGGATRRPRDDQQYGDNYAD
jgi:hypothetical protein